MKFSLRESLGSEKTGYDVPSYIIQEDMIEKEEAALGSIKAIVN